MKIRVLVTYNMFRDGYKELIEKFDVTFPPPGVESFTYNEVLEMIPQYDVLQPMFNFKVDAAIMDASKGRLKLISNYAVGFDNIDIPAATQRGIQVTNTPTPVIEPTADHAMGLMLAVARRISEADRRLRTPQSMHVGLITNLGHSLYGATLGILGMGRIGQALARRAIAAGMKIIYYNRTQLAPHIEARYNAKLVTLNQLLQQSDVVSINAPLSHSTYHIISAPQLKAMKPSAILVNTARGALVDEKALAQALKEGEIWGAGLDVFEFGDYPIEELTKLNNVVLVPHFGTQTIEVRNEMSEIVSQNIINFYNGKEIFKVNEV